MTPYNTDISTTTERLAAHAHGAGAWARYYMRFSDYTPEQARMMAELAAQIMPYTTNTLDIPRAQRP